MILSLWILLQVLIIIITTGSALVHCLQQVCARPHSGTKGGERLLFRPGDYDAESAGRRL